jgi:hypothetical protein
VISPPQGRYLYTAQHKHRINANTPNIHALSGIRTHNSGVRASEDSSCLRPSGYCDRPWPRTVHISEYYPLGYNSVGRVIRRRSSETSVNYWTTWCHTPEDGSLHGHSCENLESNCVHCSRLNRNCPVQVRSSLLGVQMFRCSH